MRYLYHGTKRAGRGRPKVFDGRIDPLNLREDQFCPCAQASDGSWTAYQAVVNIRAWKRNVLLVIEQAKDKIGNVTSYKLYACTNTNRCAAQVRYAYNCRFQIEFLYRDAKQFAGLEHCQARSKEKLHFHINTALTCVSLAKAPEFLSLDEKARKSFSMADVKTAYANDLFFNQIILWCGINPNRRLINAIRSKVRTWDPRAA